MIPCGTVSKIGMHASSSAGSPTKTIVAPRASDSYACAIGLGDAAVRTTESAPPSLPISSTQRDPRHR